MKKHLGNITSWSSVIVVLIGFFSLNPKVLAVSIIIAAIMDTFDGRLARKYGENTKYRIIFGETTDSLCDTINFGVAPSLLVALLAFQFDLSLVLKLSIGFFLWASVFRLARFHALKDKPKVEYYVGVPITVAGPILGMLMAFSSNQGFLALATIALGYLMVSNLKIKKL